MNWYPEVRYRSGEQAPLMRRVPTAIGLFLCGVMLLAASSSQNDAKITFSAEPGETVLVVTYTGGALGRTSRHILHGDGRFEYRSESSGGGSSTLLERVEIELSYQDMENLLRVAVNYGLLEASKESVATKIRELRPGGSRPVETDGGYMTVEISLTSYSRGDEEYGPVTNRITLYNPTYYSRLYDVNELHGFTELARHMTELRRQARELAAARAKD